MIVFPSDSMEFWVKLFILLPVSSSLLSACDNKPAGVKTLTPTPTPVQCGSTHPAGPPPKQRQLQPPAPQLTNNCPASHIPALSPSHHHRNLPQTNQQFVLPRPPISCPGGSISTEQRCVLITPFLSFTLQTEASSNLRSCSPTLQVPAAAVGALLVFPPSGENSERTVPAPEPGRAAAVPASPLGAPRPPRPTGFQAGAGGSTVPGAGATPAPNRLQPRHNQTRAARLWL